MHCYLSGKVIEIAEQINISCTAPNICSGCFDLRTSGLRNTYTLESNTIACTTTCIKLVRIQIQNTTGCLNNRRATNRYITGEFQTGCTRAALIFKRQSS